MGRFGSRRQHGSVVVLIMVVMLAAMLLASALVNHFATSEERAIAGSLARVRAYWAMVGHLNYFYSRAKRLHEISTNQADYKTDFGSFDFSATTNCASTAPNYDLDTDNPATLRCVIDELEDAAGLNIDQRTWTFPETGNNYTLTVLNDGTTDGLRLRIINTGSAPVLQGLENRLFGLLTSANLNSGNVEISRFERGKWW